MARGGDSPETHWKRSREVASSPLEAGAEERRSGNSPRGFTRVGEDRTGATTELGFLGVDGNSGTLDAAVFFTRFGVKKNGEHAGLYIGAIGGLNRLALEIDFQFSEVIRWGIKVFVS